MANPLRPLKTRPRSRDPEGNDPDRIERRWTPLAARMGYTSHDSQRAEILVAIDQMSWTAVDAEAAGPSFVAGPATRAMLSTVIRHQERECALGSARVAPPTNGHLLIGVQHRGGERHYLLDLPGETIHVLAEVPSEEHRSAKRGNRT